MSSLPPTPGTSQGFAVRRTPKKSPKKLILRTTLLIFLLAVGTAGFWWLRTSSVFEVQKVESGDYRFTSRDQLEEVFGSFLGQNIFSLTGNDVADSLASFPWVRDLKVRRRLPSSIEIDFREWRPLLIIEPDKPGARPLVLVEEGKVLAFPDHLILPGMPVLVGAELEKNPATGILQLSSSQKDQVLELVAGVEMSGLESACPIDFIVARSEGFAIVLQDGRGSLLVGREEFASRLGRFMDARDHLEPGLQMDLRFADRITCRRI